MNRRDCGLLQGIDMHHSSQKCLRNEMTNRRKKGNGGMPDTEMCPVFLCTRAPRGRLSARAALCQTGGRWIFPLDFIGLSSVAVRSRIIVVE